MTFAQRMMLAIVAGFLVAHAHTNVPILALFCLVPLFVALIAPSTQDEDPERNPPGLWRAILLGFTCYAVAGAHVWGIAQYGMIVYGAGVMYLATGGALFGALAWPFLRVPDRLFRVSGLVAAWVISDFTRSASAYSYPMMLGPCLADIPVLAQIACIAGPWGMDAMVAALAATLAEAVDASAIRKHPWLPTTQPLRWLKVAFGILGVTLFFGVVRLSASGAPGAMLWEPDAPEALPEDMTTIAAAQGSVPTWFYRRARSSERLQHALTTNYLDLLDDAIESRPWGAPAQWIILPESAFGKVVVAKPRGLHSIKGLTRRHLPEGTTMLLGVLTELSGFDPAYPRASMENNTVALTSNAQGHLQRLDVVAKRLLVPISEARFRPAGQWRPIQTQHTQAGILICYESMYPHIGQALSAAGAQILVVITNDAGLRWSKAPRVHARLGKLRAIESGRSLVHAGQAGISFLVDAYGRSTAEMGLFERGLMVGAVKTTPVWTFYSVTGRWWVGFFSWFWLLLALRVWIATKSQT